MALLNATGPAHVERLLTRYSPPCAWRIIMHRAGNLMIDAGLLPLHAPAKLNNPASQQLADPLSLPAPEGAVPSFVGNR